MSFVKRPDLLRKGWILDDRIRVAQSARGSTLKKRREEIASREFTRSTLDLQNSDANFTILLNPHKQQVKLNIH